MTEYDQQWCIDLMQNKELYLSMVEGYDKKMLESYYAQFSEYYFDYGKSLIHNSVALSNYISSLKTHKVDPYLAGGAANGVFGLGAGIIAGAWAAARNQAIDRDRQQWGTEAVLTTISKDADEKMLLMVAKQIYELLEKSPEYKQHKESIAIINKAEEYKKQVAGCYL